MKNTPLKIEVALQVLKPVDTVFEAIVDPAKMSNYFISKSSGRMEEGKDLIWKFPEFDMDVPVRVGKIEKNKYISYYWDVETTNHFVEIFLTSNGENATVIKVTEEGGKNDEAGIKWLMGNTEGWANFLSCLKAYLEYGINLRKGAFDWREF